MLSRLQEERDSQCRGATAQGSSLRNSWIHSWVFDNEWAYSVKQDKHPIKRSTRGLFPKPGSDNGSIHEQTYYHVCRAYGELKLPQAKQLKTLEKENARLRKAV